MRVEVLGPLQAVVDGDVVPLGGPQRRLVLALLVAAGGRTVATDRLMDRIWSGHLPDRARKTIQVHVANLRKALGAPHAIVTEGDGYRLARHVEVDVAEFEHLVVEGRGHLPERPDVAGGVLRRALLLWRGTPYGGLGDPDPLLAEIDRLEELRLSVVEDRLDADIALGRSAVSELEGMIREHPLRERLRALHMTALYRSGRQAEALAAYREFARLLAEELGLDPSPGLQQLEVQILQQDPALGPTLPQPVVPVEFSPPPARYSSFVGRRDEIAAIIDRLGRHRLVSLVGPGGIGKSSITAEVARAFEADPHHAAAWVDLERTVGGETAQAVAVSVGLRPHPASDPIELVAGLIGRRSQLLVLDGCEPVTMEAAAVADVLLTACPGLRILASSREPLGLGGEQVIRLGPLERADAVNLFCDRAGLGEDRLSGSAAAHIGAVCDALDGIPLALELAAARLRSMPLARLVGHLDAQVDLLRRSRPLEERHRSLVAVLEMSYQALDELHQSAFRSLSVFRRSFEAGAAALMAGAEEPFGVVDRLVEVSLVEPPGRDGDHRMLEPIRQYAAALLRDGGEEDDARRRHAEWMSTRCREMAGTIDTPDGLGFGAWVARNRPEIAAAVEWSLDPGTPETAMSILAAVGREIANQGFGETLMPAVREALSGSDIPPSSDLVAAMANAAHILQLAGDREAAAAMIERGRQVAACLDDRWALGTILARAAAFTADVHGTRPGLLDAFREAVSLLEATDGTNPIDYHNAARAAVAAGETELAHHYAQQCLEWELLHVGQSMGDQEAVVSILALLRGDLDEAIRLKRVAAEVWTEGHVLLYAHTEWADLASYLTYAGRYAEASEAVDAGVRVAEIVGIGNLNLAAPRMRIAAASGDGEAVLRYAADWFESVARADGPLSLRVPSFGVLLRGEYGVPSPFLDVLLPLTQTGIHRGLGRWGCRFVQAAPRLLAEAAFGAWDQIGETRRWQELARRCPESEDPGPESLEQAFAEAADWVRDLSANRAG